MIHPTAIIGPNVTIAEGVYIGPYCVIGMHAESNEVDPRTDPPGAVTIGTGTTIHELVTIQGAKEPNGCTAIGANCRIQAHAHIGHDATIGDHSTIACGAKIGGHSKVGEWCNVGLNAVLHQRSVLAEGVMVGASAFVKHYIEPWTIIAGVPAKVIGHNHRGYNNKEQKTDKKP